MSRQRHQGPLRLQHLFFFLAIAGVLLALNSPGLPLAAPAPREGRVVEEAKYIFGWNGLTAAVAEFTLSRRTEEGGPTLHFMGNARTLEGVDLLWRMRDSVMALIDGRTMGPRHFKLLRRENEKKIDLEVVNDLEEDKFRIRRMKGDQLREGTLPSRGVFDPVSAMLFLRQKSLSPGDVETVRVMEGKRIYVVKLRSLARERILMGSERLPAIKLATTYRSEDGHRSSEADGIHDAHVWVSDAPGHSILRLEARSSVGVISGERVTSNSPGRAFLGDY